MKNMTNKQKMYSLIIILIIVIIGIGCELFYYHYNPDIFNQQTETNENIKNNTFEHNKVINKFNLAKKKLQVENDKHPNIIFGSDYQGDNRYNNMKEILDKNYKELNPNLFVFCGDYQDSSDNDIDSTEYGIIELYTLISNYYKESIPRLFIQGNHDTLKAYGISEDGIYESEKYIVYVLNRDSFPNNQDQQTNSEEVVKKTSESLKNDLQSLVDKKSNKPVFITTHVPLHYSTRNGGNDNKYSKYIVDVLNEYGNKLDIVYLFGHNHSGKYDDYIGGSINYIPDGSTIKVGGTNEEKMINFTYMNAGYIGYSNNSLNQTTTNTTSVSSITIDDDKLSIQKYNKYGSYYKEPIIVKLKNK